METAKKNYAMYQQMCDFDKITSKQQQIAGMHTS
jgi:hypothetical protein